MFLAVLSACDAPDGRESVEQPFDNMAFSVATVDNHSPAWGSGDEWRVDHEPALEIGSVGGGEPYLFQEVVAATRLGDGRVVVVERGYGQRNEVRVFDDSGTHLVTFGGRGEGPGEFGNAPGILALPGDTILAFDPLLYRYSWFLPSGQLIQDETFSREAASTHLAGVALRTPLLFTDGAFVLVGAHRPYFGASPEPTEEELAEDGIIAMSPIPEELGRNDIRVTVFQFGGEAAVRLGRFPESEYGFVPTASGGPPVWVENPYRPQVNVSVDPTRGHVHLTNPEQREIQTFNVNGDLVRIVRVHQPLESVSPDRIVRARAALLSSVPASVVEPAAVAVLFDRIQFPDSIHPYGKIEVDAGSNLWVEEHDPEVTAESRFQVFDAEGGWLGVVSVPPELDRILEIGSDYLLGTVVDELGVPYVRLHRLERDR